MRGLAGVALLLLGCGAAAAAQDAEALAAACEEASVPCTLRLQPGYDHSYFFIASFIDEHLRYHAEKLQ